MNHKRENRDGAQVEAPNAIEQNIVLQLSSQESQKRYIETNDKQRCSRQSKRVQFEAISKPDQNRYEIQDEMLKYTNKYTGIFVLDQDLKDSFFL